MTFSKLSKISVKLEEQNDTLMKLRNYQSKPNLRIWIASMQVLRPTFVSLYADTSNNKIPLTIIFLKPFGGEDET